jgi:hypothetical protein
MLDEIEPAEKQGKAIGNEQRMRNIESIQSDFNKSLDELVKEDTSMRNFNKDSSQQSKNNSQH